MIQSWGEAGAGALCEAVLGTLLTSPPFELALSEAVAPRDPVAHLPDLCILKFCLIESVSS